MGVVYSFVVQPPSQCGLESVFLSLELAAMWSKSTCAAYATPSLLLLLKGSPLASSREVGGFDDMAREIWSNKRQLYAPSSRCAVADFVADNGSVPSST